ncbi:MAG: putative metal-dependent hydrolase [Acidimicrobiia bacterium]|nr:putative metal-dependent hydrolase [Acidimicrobiia bacterium]
MSTTVDLRYPVGRFDPTAPVDPARRAPAIEDIAQLPAKMREAVAGLSDAQLDTPYRPGGWTVRQVVHHVADSHMNGLIRTKLALSEDTPTIKPYDENVWATHADMRLPVAVSLGILEGVHARWAAVWLGLSPADFARAFVHPEIGRMSLDTQLQSYAWHSRHHVAHIASLRVRERW